MTPIEGDPAEFQLIVILSGRGELYDSDGAYPFVAGQTWFVPADLTLAMLQPKEETSLLRITVPDKDGLRGELERMGFEPEAISHVLVA